MSTERSLQRALNVADWRTRQNVSSNADDAIEFGGMDRPRVRFAPSPTGYLHVGGARTALFNWLFARRHGGTFILRIEDTDTERSSDEMVAGILESMRWLGLDWDEGPGIGGPHAPYFQTQRFERHHERPRTAARERVRLQVLLLAGTAEGKARRGGESRAAAGSTIAPASAFRPKSGSGSKRPACSRPSASRCPTGKTSYTDHVRGRIEVDHEQIEDFVILRSNGLPIYHLSVVADDIDMGITHVIRGDDHISNTPKHILLWQALGRTPPEFAHVPLILGTDKKKLSKRHGITSVTEYERLGYLPDAMVNFLALLGWSPGGDRELMSRDELIAAFSLDGISGGAAVFDPEKLDWFNAQYLAQLTPDDLVRACESRCCRRPACGRTSYDDAGRQRMAAAGVAARAAARAAVARFRRAGAPVSDGSGRLRSGSGAEAPDDGRSRRHVEALIAALEADAGAVR